jgi:hypothetical protein
LSRWRLRKDFSELRTFTTSPEGLPARDEPTGG